jgi:hypothetical protein
MSTYLIGIALNTLHRAVPKRPRTVSPAGITKSAARAGHTGVAFNAGARGKGGRDADRRLHARQQPISMLDTATGEIVEKTLKLKLAGDAVQEFYAGLERPVLVGIEVDRIRCSGFCSCQKCQVGYPRRAAHSLLVSCGLRKAYAN